MSVADVFSTAEELMDLKLSQKTEAQLIYPYSQVRSVPNSNRREIKIFNFPDADFNRLNRISIPSMDLNVTEMYVEIQLSAETNLSGNSALWEPASTWLTLKGVDLLYKNDSVINMSEPECTMAMILDERDNIFIGQQRATSLDLANAESATKIYLPLNHICNQVLSKIGSISAYNSGDWTLTVDLRPQLEVESGASQWNTAPTATMTAMRLMCVGHKVPVGEIMIQKQALYSNGITWNFLRSHRFRTTIPETVSSSNPITQTFSSVRGNVSHVRMMNRANSGYTTTDPTAKDNIDFDQFDFYATTNTIEIGRTSNPYEVFGQGIYPPFVKTFFPKSNLGQSSYLQTDSETGSVIQTDSSILDISFAESVCDVLNGCSTGSYPVDSDFRITLKLTDSNNVLQLLDTIIYTHVRTVITMKQVNINSSA